jgi:hypothetical protein
LVADVHVRRKEEMKVGVGLYGGMMESEWVVTAVVESLPTYISYANILKRWGAIVGRTISHER